MNCKVEKISNPARKLISVMYIYTWDVADILDRFTFSSFHFLKIIL
jgi:hypothetical protein